MIQQISREEQVSKKRTIPLPADMTPEERRRRVEEISYEIAGWSTELNQRLA